jgi:hypothetical protein
MERLIEENAVRESPKCQFEVLPLVKPSRPDATAREKLESTSLAAAFVGPEFTLSDLRVVRSGGSVSC